MERLLSLRNKIAHLSGCDFVHLNDKQFWLFNEHLTFRYFSNLVYQLLIFGHQNSLFCSFLSISSNACMCNFLLVRRFSLLNWKTLTCFKRTELSWNFILRYSSPLPWIFSCSPLSYIIIVLHYPTFQIYILNSCCRLFHQILLLFCMLFKTDVMW